MSALGLLHSVALVAIKAYGRRYEIGDKLPPLSAADLDQLGDRVAPGLTAEQVEALVAAGRLPPDALARLDAGEEVAEIPQADAASLAGAGSAGAAGGTAPAASTDTPDDASKSTGAAEGIPGGAAGQAPNPTPAEDAARTEPPASGSEGVSAQDQAPAANGRKGRK
ncbi:hypothetical protein KXS07_23735 [Inquilinus limosus]|uniref:hypothetical protein n=1 Tax=Inquilinus limosus TaxID=171674 RepID=UPI003F13ED3F